LGDVGDEVLVTVLVDDEHLTTMPEVAERLRAVGLVVESQGGQTGVITGWIDASRASMLEQVQGVQRVEIPRRFQLPPPDCDLQ
jgi:dihydrodipicolinate synthase/N-acetylneuraminate lyase